MRKNSQVADRLRQTAYLLWEQDGRPEGRAFDYWLRAKDMLVREMAYDKWLAEGTPELPGEVVARVPRDPGERVEVEAEGVIG